jgi:hypothetical protein
MGIKTFRNYGVGAASLLFAACLGMCQQATQGRETKASANVDPPMSLTADQIVRKLEVRNAERAAALNQYEAVRVYRMQYHGLPSDHGAEMVVDVTYNAPDSKQFKVISQSGSKFIIDHVLKKLLEGEQEAANEENRRHTALSTDNYDFTLAGQEAGPNGRQYVLNIFPKNKNRFLYRGKIWVDATDFAVVRIKGEPAKNPSFWIKRTEIEHNYRKVNDFWLPAENRTQSTVRLGGVADLSIEYKDYKITKATALRGSKCKDEQTRLDSQRTNCQDASGLANAVTK